MSFAGDATSKTIVLNYIERADYLAREIADRFTRWKSDRQQWELEKTELIGYVFATDTKKTTNKKLPWRNKTTLPKLCQIRDNLHANYMAALFPEDDWFLWEGGDESSALATKARAITSYMKNKTRTSQFKSEMSQLVYDFIDYGNAFADTVYVDERFELQDGKELQGYVGPKLVRISPLDIVFNIAANSFRDSPKITRSLVSIGDVARSIDVHPENEHFQEVMKKMNDIRYHFRGVGHSSGSFSNVDRHVLESFNVHGFGTPQAYFESDMVEILEFEGDIYDPDTEELLQNHVVTVVDRMFVVRNDPINNWLGKSTKTHVGWRLRPDTLLAMGPLDNLVGMQYRIDHLENIKADMFDLVALPPVKVKGDVDEFTWQPLEQIRMETDADVSTLSLDSTALTADNQIAILQNQMEEFAGAPKQAMGFRTPGEKTAFEVNALATGASRIFQNKATFFEDQFVEPNMNNMLESARRNLNVVDIVSSMDDDFGVVDFLEITPEDLKASGKLRPVGARHFAEQARMVQNITTFSNSAVGQDPAVAVHVSGFKIAKMMEGALNLNRYNIVAENVRIAEMADTARAQQAAQQDVSEEDAIPEEEIPQEEEGGLV